jgi:hypothetical protein
MTVFHTGCQRSAGLVRETAASGTNTSCSTTVCEPVARIPMVSHVSSMLTPSVANGTEKWITCAPSGPLSQRALLTTMSPTGAPLDGVLRAVTRNPPSTGVAIPFELTQSAAPVETSST